MEKCPLNLDAKPERKGRANPTRGRYKMEVIQLARMLGEVKRQRRELLNMCFGGKEPEEEVEPVEKTEDEKELELKEKYKKIAKYMGQKS